MSEIYCADDLGKNNFTFNDVVEESYHANKDKKSFWKGVYSDFDGTYGIKDPHKIIKEGAFRTDTGVGVVELAIEKGYVSQELFREKLLPKQVLDFVHQENFANREDKQRAHNLLKLKDAFVDLYDQDKRKDVANMYLKLQQELVWLEDEYMIKKYGIEGGKFSFYRLLEGMGKKDIQALSKKLASRVSINATLKDGLLRHKELDKRAEIVIVTANIAEIVSSLIQKDCPIVKVVATEMEYEGKRFTPKIITFNNGEGKTRTIENREILPIGCSGDTGSDIHMMAHTLEVNPDSYVNIVFPHGKDPEKISDYFVGGIMNVLNGDWEEKMRGRIYLSEFNPMPLISPYNHSKNEERQTNA